jgi:hypothetical protein
MEYYAPGIVSTLTLLRRIEANLGIIASNLAPMRGVIHFFKKRVSQYSRSRSHIQGSKAGMPPGSGPSYGAHSYGSRMYPEQSEAEIEAGRASSGGSDASEIPLKDIMQTRSFHVTQSDATSWREKDPYEMRE